METVRRAISRVPEIKQEDPFAGVSLSGSQEDYRDRIASQYPPQVLSLQERAALGIENLLEEQQKQTELDREIMRIMGGINGPRLAQIL